MAASESTPGIDTFKVLAIVRSGSPLSSAPNGRRAASSSSRTVSLAAARWSTSASDSCAEQPQSGDERDREGAWPKAAFLASAEHQGLERWALVAAPPRDERADSLGGADLVARDGQQVDAGVLEQLRSVCRTPEPHQRGGTHHVRRARSAISSIGWITPVSLFTAITDTSSVSGRKCCLDSFGGDPAARIWCEQIDLEASCLQALQWFEYGLVLDLGRDDVSLADALAVGGESEDRQVVALGCAAGEDDLVGLCADHARDLLACTLDPFLRHLAVGVGAAPGVAELVRHVGQHLVGNAWVHRRGGRVIEVRRAGAGCPADVLCRRRALRSCS